MQNTAVYTKKIRQVVYFHNALLLEPKNKYSLIKKEQRRSAIYVRLIAPYTIKSFKWADAIICQTLTIKEKLKQVAPESKVFVIPPQVYVDPKYRDSSDIQINGFIYPTSPLSFKKIIEVINCVRNNREWFNNNNLELLITIDGTENAYAKIVHERAKDISCVKCIGYQKREELFELYQRYAVIINSETESYPLPLLEAGIIGTPIIAADNPYAVEILKNNKKAILYKRNDLKEMFNAMQSIITDREKNIMFFK